MQNAERPGMPGPEGKIDLLGFDLPPAVVEENQKIKNKIAMKTEGETCRAIYFCSPTGGEGTSTVVATLGITLAAHSRKTVLIIKDDADKHPIYQRFRSAVNPPRSKSEEEGRGAPPREGLYCRSFPASDDLIMPLLAMLAGGSGQLDGYDYILVDGRPLERTADLSDLAEAISGVVLVVESEKNKLNTLAEMKDEIESAGVKLLGSILNKRKNYIPWFIAGAV